MMACPQCLEKDTLRMLVNIIVDCPFNQPSLDKSAIRKKEVQIEAVDWGNTEVYCECCGYSLQCYRKRNEPL